MSRFADDLEEFCELEWPRLVGSLGLYLGDEQAAEDLAQEALVRVAERWRTVREMASPSAWAHRVAFNLAKSHWRRIAIHRRAVLRIVDPSLSDDADLDASLSVRDALGALPDRERAVLVLRYFADLSVADTAVALGCPQNTVKTNTRRGLVALRAQLGALDAPELEEDLR